MHCVIPPYASIDDPPNAVRTNFCGEIASTLSCTLKCYINRVLIHPVERAPKYLEVQSARPTFSSQTVRSVRTADDSATGSRAHKRL